MDYSKLSDSTLKEIAEGRELDYSKLSDVELKAIAETSGESTQLAQPSKTSALEAGLIGASQGLTFGLADELEGAIRAIPSEGEESYLDRYKKYRDLARARLEGARDDQYWATMAGEIAGGLPIGGLAAKTLKNVPLFASTLKATPGTLKGDAAGILNWFSPTMKEAVAAGAVGGLGYAEGDSLGEQASSAATGAATAGGLIGAGKLLKEGLRVGKSAVGAIGDVRPIQDIKDAFLKAAPQADEALPFDFNKIDLSQSGQALAYKKAREATDSFIKTIAKIKKTVGKEYEQLLTPAADATEEHLKFASTPIEVKDTLLKFRAQVEPLLEDLSLDEAERKRAADVLKMLDDNLEGIERVVEKSVVKELPTGLQKAAERGMLTKKEGEILNWRWEDITTEVNPIPEHPGLAAVVVKRPMRKYEKFKIDPEIYKTKKFPLATKASIVSQEFKVSKKEVDKLKPSEIDDLFKLIDLEAIDGTIPLNRVIIRDLPEELQHHGIFKIDELKEILGPRMQEVITKRVKERSAAKTALTPKEIMELQTKFRKLTSNLYENKQSQVAKALTTEATPETPSENITQALRNIIEKEAPENLTTSTGEVLSSIKDLSKKYKSAVDAERAMLASDNTFEDVPKERLQENIFKLFSQAERESGITGQEKQERLSRVLAHIKEASPETQKELAPKFTSVAKQLDIQQKAAETGLGAAMSGRGRTLRIANWLGQANPLGIRSLAEQVRNLPSTGAYKLGSQAIDKVATTLEKVSSADKIKRNAALFSLMQDPGTRAVLDSLNIDKD